MKIELGKSKFHEGELDYSELPDFPNSEHGAERNYRLAKTLRLLARRRYVSVEIVQWQFKDKTVHRWAKAHRSFPLRSTSQAACKPVHVASMSAI